MTILGHGSAAPVEGAHVDFQAADQKGRIGRQLNRCLRFFLTCLALLGFLAATAPGTAFAQSDPGFKGWGWNNVYYATPQEACYAMWDQYYNPEAPSSRFIGALDAENPIKYNCLWTSYQYLCPAETGGAIVNCGTVLPSSVTLSCNTGYSPMAGNVCVADYQHEPERCEKCLINLIE